MAFHPAFRILKYCFECCNLIDCTIYKDGIGHADDCMIKDCYLDEDFARWSNLHIDEAGNMEETCKICKKFIHDNCKCHLEVTK